MITTLIISLVALYIMIGLTISAKSNAKFTTWSWDIGPGPIFTFVLWPIFVFGMGLYYIFKE